MFSDLLWNIKTTIIMHRFFPNIYNLCYIGDKSKIKDAFEYRSLHRWHCEKSYYENKLKEGTYTY
jgi:hypothetical protein